MRGARPRRPLRVRTRFGHAKRRSLATLEAVRRSLAMSRHLLAALACLGLIAFAGCGESSVPAAGGSSDAAKSSSTPMPGPTTEQLADWTKRLERLAAGYQGLSRVDDMSRWAPTACRAPVRPARATRSAADPKAAAHGQKIYALWAKDVRSYGRLSGLLLQEWSLDGRERLAKVEGIDGCAQVVVKEAFEAVEMAASEADAPLDGANGHARWSAMRPASQAGKRYRPGTPKGLFVMMQLDAPTPAADEGWIYGTVAPDGVVTGVGRMEACMACHRAAPHGRLFGLASAGNGN